jgi:uncharacterized protein
VNIVISGSSGLIGTALRKALRDRGDHPIRLVRSESSQEGDIIRWSPTEGRIEADRLRGVDAVIHLAAEPLIARWTSAKKRRIRESRVAGTRTLAEAMASVSNPPAVLLSGSASGYYGLRGDEILTEESSSGSGFLADVCRDWEEATSPASEAGVRVVQLRTTPVLSRDAVFLKLQLLPFRLGLGGKLSSGKQWLPWIHVDDYVRAVLHLLDDQTASGPVNMVAPDVVRQKEFAKTLGEVLNRPALLTLPKPVVALVFGRTAAEEFAMASQRVQPKRLTEEFGFRFAHPELEGALRDVLDRPEPSAAT